MLSTISGGHKRSIRSVAWKPGVKGEAESVLATGSFDATAGIWRGENRRGERGFGEEAGFTREGLGMGQDEDVGMTDDTEKDEVEDEAEEEEDADDWFKFAVILEGHDSEIKSVAWSCHGGFLATCSRDKSVWIWESIEEGGAGGGIGGALGAGGDDEDNYETVAVLQEHEGDVKCVAWHPAEESCLVSGSYDETVRIWREDADGEWGCVGLCEGHEGTVWCVDWEPVPKGNAFVKGEALTNGDTVRDDRAQNTDDGTESGPRIISASADSTIRVWRRAPKAPRAPLNASEPRIRSIIRSSSDEEDWTEEARLPQRHDRAVYAVAWSRRSGRVVSCGSDGKILVYEEGRVEVEGSQEGDGKEWMVVAEAEGAHGVYEVNSVCWARRYDKGRRNQEEEVIVSTGDDGEVKVWTLDET